MLTYNELIKNIGYKKVPKKYELAYDGFIEYAKKIDVPFAYSSNGSCFIEHDFLSGRETEIPIQNFPSAEELFARLTNESHNGNGLSSNEWNSFID